MGESGSAPMRAVGEIPNEEKTSFAIAEAVVFVPEPPVLFDKGLDDGESVGGEFLILGTKDFVMSLLLERDVSADEENKPANLLRLFLNYSE